MGKGVYLPSTNLDSSLMVNCLQALLSAHPSIKFTSVNFDENLRGFKICFSEPVEKTVLEKEYLTIAEHDIFIYPLTTVLTVHGIVRNASSSFKTDLQDAINERFGKFLDVIKIEKSLFTEDWRVLVDIPEFNELNVFHQESFPDMTIWLPKWKKEFKVTSWCRRCERSGHFQHECVAKTHPEMKKENHKSSGHFQRECVAKTHPEMNKENHKSNANEKITETKRDETEAVRNTQVQSNSRSPPLPRNPAEATEFEKYIQKSLDSYAQEIGRTEIMNSGIFSEANLKLGRTQRNDTTSSNSSAPKAVSNNVLTDREIKKESEVHDDDEKIRNKKYHSGSNEDRGSRVVPKEEPRSRMDDESSHSFDEPPLHKNDDEVLFIGYTNKSNPVSASSHDSNTAGKDGAYNSEDASRSPTNSRMNYNFALFPETEPFSMTPGPSRRIPSKPSTRVEVTSVLSGRLQDCINEACDTCKVLDREKLDAFLIHVKKKSNPIRVASNFTKNTNGLKEQLKKILNIYYLTPETGTKEDMQFIKWLNGLVNRFDGTIPRKRKRQSSDESPNKK